jgi:hypothetical protein
MKSHSHLEGVRSYEGPSETMPAQFQESTLPHVNNFKFSNIYINKGSGRIFTKLDKNDFFSYVIVNNIFRNFVFTIHHLEELFRILW